MAYDDLFSPGGGASRRASDVHGDVFQFEINPVALSFLLLLRMVVSLFGRFRVSLNLPLALLRLFLFASP